MKIDSSTPSADTAPRTQMQGTTDEFLKLFMAQLQNQDPLDPKSGSDMVAQLAQLTAVEQTRQTNAQLADLAAAQASTASAGLANLVGRSVDAALGDVQLDAQGGQALPPIEISATGPIKGGAVVIIDATGKELRRIPIADGVRSATVTWDGKDASGKPLAPGAYRVEVDDGATSGTISATWRAKVDAVELTADGPRLRMGGLLFAPAAVRTIGAYPTPSYPLPGASSTTSVSSTTTSGLLGPGLTA